MSRRAVLFDLDGAIIDSRAAARQCLAELVAEATGHLPGPAALDAAVLRPPVDALTGLGVSDAAGVYERRYDSVLERCTGRLTVFRHVVTGMVALFEQRVFLAVVTRQARRRLPLLLPEVVDDLAEEVIAFEDAAPKPAPDGLLTALARIGAHPADAMFVGDSPEDMTAARRAGVLPVAVAWGYHDPLALREAGAEVLLRDPAQVGPGLLRLLDAHRAHDRAIWSRTATGTRYPGHATGPQGTVHVITDVTHGSRSHGKPRGGAAS